MPLFPFDRFSIATYLTPEEAHRVLAAAIEPPRRMFGAGPARCPFQGELGVDSFGMSRNITYRNSFLPRIRGRILPTAGGSTVEGAMTLHPIVLCFMIVWFGLLFLFSGIIWTTMLMSGAWQSWALIPLAMLAFGWALTSGGFTYEARKAHALLTGILTQSTALPNTPTLVA